MIKLLYLLTLFVAFSCGQSPPSEPEQESDPKSGSGTTAGPSVTSSNASHQLENMEDIRREYGYISSRAESNSLDATFFDYNCHGERTGRVVYLSDEQGLRLIRHTYNEYSHFSATDEYFVKDNSLFSVFYRHVSWHFVGEGETRDDVTERRFYIIGGNPLRCLEKKFSFRSPSSASMRSQAAANRETDCSSLGAVLDRFESLARYGSGGKKPDCLEE